MTDNMAAVRGVPTLHQLEDARSRAGNRWYAASARVVSLDIDSDRDAFLEACRESDRLWAEWERLHEAVRAVRS